MTDRFVPVDVILIDREVYAHLAPSHQNQTRPRNGGEQVSAVLSREAMMVSPPTRGQPLIESDEAIADA